MSQPTSQKSDHARARDLPALCLSSIYWSDIWSRPQQLMNLYSRRAPVIFVEPPAGIRRALKRSSMRPKLQQISDQLSIFSVAKSLPVNMDFQALKAFNESLLRLAVEHAANRTGIDEHLLWCYFHENFAFRRLPSTSLVVYDCADDWSAFWKTRPDVLEREMKLVAMSDMVLTVSQPLYEIMKRKNPHTYLVRNGVDFEHFKIASQEQETPVMMKSISHPIVGFSGSIDTWIDLDIIEAVAKRRPDWSFVLLGPVDDEIRKNPASSNMHYLGHIPYKNLPSYLAQFDVCIIPFRRTDFTESADPIKLYEYLATGKPIISTGLPESRKFANLVAIGEGAPEFERAIANALEGDSSDLARARQAAARENSWDARLELTMRFINERREELRV